MTPDVNLPHSHLPPTAEEVAGLREQLARLEQDNLRLTHEVAELRNGMHEAERYRFLFERMDLGFCIIEFIDGPHGPMSDYVHLTANPSYLRHSGLCNVVGRTLREVLPDETETWLERFGAVARTGEPLYFEHELRATDRCLGMAAIRIEPAERCQVAVIFRNITERTRAEAALQALNEQLEQRVTQVLAERKLFADLVDSSIACVQVVDLHMHWLAVNLTARRELEELFGTQPEPGMSLETYFKAGTPDCQRSLELCRRALTGDAFIEIAAFGEGARQRHYEMRFAPLLGPDGQTRGAYLFAYDISERVHEQARLQKTEEALRQAQKMEAVGQLTGGVAHDFNNLLGGILGSLELAEQRLPDGRDDSVPGLLHNARSAAQRAASLVHRLLAFSRRQTLQPLTLDVDKLVAGMHELISRTVGPHIRLLHTPNPHLWSVRLDPPQLESALLNLCINARDAMPSGGDIHITCYNHTLDPEQAATLDIPARHYVCLSVVDNGCGMSAEVMDRAIDPFFTTKPIGQGTGLGLSMVYGFVRQSGGQLRLESSPGRGTQVVLFLPRHEASTYLHSPVLPSAPAGKPQTASRRVLVVDDERTMRSVMQEVIAEMGHETFTFGDGPATLEGLEQLPCPDLLVTDIGLPGGLDGRQLADTLRARFPGLKVLFVTGYDENAALRDGTLEPGMSVLTKPFVLATFAERVSQLLAD